MHRKAEPSLSQAHRNFLQSPRSNATTGKSREKTERIPARLLSSEPPLFCSVARGEPTAESDIDLLVEFSRPIGLLQFVELKRILEEVFERSVDLVTPKALKPQLRDGILKEAIRAA